MVRQHRAFVCAAILAPLLYPNAWAIIIRPDRDDALYVEFAKEFPAVCRVIMVGKRSVLIRDGERRSMEVGGSGTLIAPRWVLTAAHVVTDAVQAGDKIAVEFANARYEASQIVMYPGAEGLVRTDLALIELARPVEGIEPLPIYVGDKEQGQIAAIVGYGAAGTFESGHPLAWEQLAQPIQRRAGTNVISRIFRDDRCLTNISDLTAATDLECGGGTGDSGGPALIQIDGKYQVAGVLSASPGGGSTGVMQSYGDEDDFERVSHYARWIVSVTGVDFGAPKVRWRWLLAAMILALIVAAAWEVRRSLFTPHLAPRSEGGAHRPLQPQSGDG